MYVFFYLRKNAIDIMENLIIGKSESEYFEFLTEIRIAFTIIFSLNFR